MKSAEPPVTIGVVTHEKSSFFSDFLRGLEEAIEFYGNDITLLVANNSGPDARSKVDAHIEKSRILRLCTVTVLDSPENNISVGRNLILDHTETRFLLFADDDEIATKQWIAAMVNLQIESGFAVVAGPTLPIYPPDTKPWVSALDLHNTRHRKTGDVLGRVGAGNCLIDLEQINNHRFDPEFGKTGGEDSLFFDQLTRNGMPAIWCENAVVHELIPDSRTSASYMVFRCMAQGQIYKRVVLRRADFKKKALFAIKAGVVAPVSIALGTLLLPVHTQAAATWLKRGYTNLGKLIKPTRMLYG